jgi:hypothetical protein
MRNEKTTTTEKMSKVYKAKLIMEGLVFLGYKTEDYSNMVKLLGSQDNLLDFIQHQLS